MRIGICGTGYVGKALGRFFRRSPQNIVLPYDKFIDGIDTPAHRAAVNTAQVVFVAVPTPSGPNGVCDTAAVEEAVSWITAPICIKSTVCPGTVDRLCGETGKRIAFSPEYIGESASHPWTEIDAAGFLIVGGDDDVTNLIVEAYRTCAGEDLQIERTTARAAELCKYMENSFLATKVAFTNQFFDIASALGVDFCEVRRLWLLDARIGQSHTEVTRERGFSGRCLPKDLLALISLMSARGGAPLLQSVFDYNESLRARQEQTA